MAKLFPIRLGVEPEAVGATIEALKKMRGVLKIDLDLDNGPRKPNGHAEPEPSRRRGVFATPGREFMLQALYKHKQLTTDELRQAFSAAGRSDKSISSVMHVLKTSGDIKRADDGSGWLLTKGARDRLRHKQPKSKTKK
jgi:hypothetical protein